MNADTGKVHQCSKRIIVAVLTLPVSEKPDAAEGITKQWR